MLMTVRVLTVATQVHEMSISTTTHLRLASSLEERLHNDIAKAIEVEATATNRLRLVMSEGVEVFYELSEPTLLQRSTSTPATGTAAGNRSALAI